MSRALRDRIIYELQQVRAELHEVCRTLTPSDLEYAPALGMRTLRGQLLEIKSTQDQIAEMILTGKYVSFSEPTDKEEQATCNELLNRLDITLSQLTTYLNSLENTDFANTIEVPESWQDFLGTTNIEIDELARWLARHEYYHIGQIVSYRWAQGHNPYESPTMES